jgi:hypothetical protein
MDDPEIHCGEVQGCWVGETDKDGNTICHEREGDPVTQVCSQAHGDMDLTTGAWQEYCKPEDCDHPNDQGCIPTNTGIPCYSISPFCVGYRPNGVSCDPGKDGKENCKPYFSGEGNWMVCPVVNGVQSYSPDMIHCVYDMEVDGSTQQVYLDISPNAMCQTLQDIADGKCVCNVDAGQCFGISAPGQQEGMPGEIFRYVRHLKTFGRRAVKEVYKEFYAAAGFYWNKEYADPEKTVFIECDEEHATSWQGCLPDFETTCDLGGYDSSVDADGDYCRSAASECPEGQEMFHDSFLGFPGCYEVGEISCPAGERRGDECLKHTGPTPDDGTGCPEGQAQRGDHCYWTYTDGDIQCSLGGDDWEDAGNGKCRRMSGDYPAQSYVACTGADNEDGTPHWACEQIFGEDGNPVACDPDDGGGSGGEGGGGAAASSCKTDVTQSCRMGIEENCPTAMQPGADGTCSGGAHLVSGGCLLACYEEEANEHPDACQPKNFFTCGQPQNGGEVTGDADGVCTETFCPSGYTSLDDGGCLDDNAKWYKCDPDFYYNQSTGLCERTYWDWWWGEYTETHPPRKTCGPSDSGCNQGPFCDPGPCVINPNTETVDLVSCDPRTFSGGDGSSCICPEDPAKRTNEPEGLCYAAPGGHPQFQ